MARLPRLYVAGQTQHIIQRGHNGQVIFTDDDDYQLFTELLRNAVREYELAVHAYVLMPNHLHLLATPTHEQAAGLVMQSVGRRYVIHFNRKSKRKGSLWEGRYRSTLIESERYLFFCSRYVELNPVRAGLVSDPGDYRWSSYAHHVGIRPESRLSLPPPSLTQPELRPNPLVTDHPLYWALGNTPFERQGRYRALFDQALTEDEINALRSATNKGWAFGSPAFLSQVQPMSNRRASPMPKGRPPKTGAEQV
jgi:putative transposase